MIIAEKAKRGLMLAATSCALAAIVSGALVTERVAGLQTAHWLLGTAAVVLALPFSTWWLILPGMALALLPVPVILHALSSPLVLGGTTVFVLPVTGVRSQVSAGLRKLILAAPPLVMVQILLGAAYRHKAIGVMGHLAGAMTVAGVMVMLCVVLLRQEELQQRTRRAAGWLIGILITQVTLGMTVLLLRMLDMEAAIPAAAHVTGGSLTFAASLALVRTTQRS